MEGNPKPILLVEPFKTAITCIRYYPQFKKLLFGSADGSVHVFLRQQDTSQRWIHECSHDLHDIQNGTITNVALSNQDRQLVSAARDGTLLVTVIHSSICDSESCFFSKETGNEENSIAADSEVESLPLVRRDASEEVEDIIGEETFSIDEADEKEAAKQAEEDAQLKKRRLLKYVQKLRDQLQELKNENERSEPSRKLEIEHFRIDEGKIACCAFVMIRWIGLKEIVDEEYKEQIAQMRKLIDFDLESAFVGLNKLYNKYFSRIESFEETLSGLTSSLKVTSFCIEKDDRERVMHEQEQKRDSTIASKCSKSRQTPVKETESSLGLSTFLFPCF